MPECPFCKKEIPESKNIKKHERFCSANPDRANKKKTAPDISEVETRVKEAAAPPNTEKEEKQTLKSEQTASDFFHSLPKWTASPPSFIMRLKMKRSGLKFKAVVFVSKDGSADVAYLPYDEEKSRIVVEGVGVWPINIKNDTIFLSKEKLLPLADCPDLSRFQNSANYVWSVYNGGYQEGLTNRFDELMDNINKERMFKWICLIVAILAIISVGVVVYTDGQTISRLIASNAELNKVIINQTGTILR